MHKLDILAKKTKILIFTKHVLNVKFNDSAFWSSNFNSTTISVENRKYEIVQNNGHIIIRRRVSHLWDLLGLTASRQLAYAIGQISTEGNISVLKIQVCIRQILEYLYILSIIIYGIVSIFVMIENMVIGIGILLTSSLILVVIYRIISSGIYKFYIDLNNDINYFN